jgi:branched-chain amino acid transport system ATP-binding protein
MILSLEDLAVGYNGCAIIQGLSLALGERQSLLIIGHNGAGKSTLLRTLFGLLPVVAGEGMLLGEPLHEVTPQKLLKKGARFLGQGVRAFDEIKIRESRMLLQRLYGLAPADPPPFEAGCLGDRRRVGELSVGQRKLEALNLLSAGRPTLFLMDEPTAGLDQTHQQVLFRWIRGQIGIGVSFLIVEQNFRELLPLISLTCVLRERKVSYYGQSIDLADDRRLATVFL